MPAPYSSTYLKVGGLWIMTVRSGETYANLDSNAPVGSIASDPGNEALYFKKSTGWKAVTTA